LEIRGDQRAIASEKRYAHAAEGGKGWSGKEGGKMLVAPPEYVGSAPAREAVEKGVDIVCGDRVKDAVSTEGKNGRGYRRG
jgi:hypothetical protein